MAASEWGCNFSTNGQFSVGKLVMEILKAPTCEHFLYKRSYIIFPPWNSRMTLSPDTHRSH